MSARTPKKMAALSARIFGNVVRAPNMRSPTKYVKRMLKGQNMVDYTKHAPHFDKRLHKPLRALGLFYDEERDWRERMIAENKLRGKFITKKGEGKRDGKKKK